MRIAQYLAVAALLALTGSEAALAADPSGIWLTQTGGSRIRVADCGGALCGTIMWLKEPNDPDTGKPKTDKNNSDDDILRAGMSVRRSVLGDAHVDRAIASTTPLTAEFQSLITRYAWGEIWSRPALDVRTRRILVIGTLLALHHW